MGISWGVGWLGMSWRWSGGTWDGEGSVGECRFGLLALGMSWRLMGKVRGKVQGGSGRWSGGRSRGWRGGGWGGLGGGGFTVGVAVGASVGVGDAVAVAGDGWGGMLQCWAQVRTLAGELSSRRDELALRTVCSAAWWAESAVDLAACWRRRSCSVLPVFGGWVRLKMVLRAALAARVVMVREMRAPVPAGSLPEETLGSPWVSWAISRRAVSAVSPSECWSISSAPVRGLIAAGGRFRPWAAFSEACGGFQVSGASREAAEAVLGLLGRMRASSDRGLGGIWAVFA